MRLATHLFLRLLLAVMFINDIRTTHKVKLKDATLHRELTSSQKSERVFYYIVLIFGLLVPFDWPYLVATLIALVYFFYFTDREIYLGSRSMYFRAQYFEYKRIENIQFENNTLQFDYKGEHIKLAHPYIDKGMLERECIYKVKKLKANSEKRKHKEKK